MNSLRFSQALVPGLIAGVLSIFTSWLWMGSIFHRFQKLTPQTWRPETGRSHALSSAVHILAALGIALLFTIVAGDQSSPFAAGMGGSLQFALACWGVFALPILLGAAIYINLHPLVVVGQLLDWLSLFAAGDGDHRVVAESLGCAGRERGGAGTEPVGAERHRRSPEG